MTVFKIGDKARIRKDINGGTFYRSCTVEACYCNMSMTNYAGDVVVVSEKDGRTGFMHLRKVEDGFTTEMPYSWSDDMLEPIEEEKEPVSHGFLRVGAVVKIRSDIAKRVDKKNRIWITLNGEKHASFPVNNQIIKESGGKTVVITEVLSRPGHMDGCAYLARFAGGENIAQVFDITMFNCLEDWLLEVVKIVKPSDDKPKPNFKVGDKVVIKTTISSGECIDHITIQRFMYDQAYDESDPSNPRRRIGTVSHVYQSGKLGISFEHSDKEFTWPRDAFELYNGDNDKPDQTKKQPLKKRKKKPDSTADYSGYTPKSEFYCYDYLNRAGKFVPSEKVFRNITKIEVTVMSGDETGCFYGVLNGNPWQCKFDAMESRFQSYDDGSYTVEGRENIEKWINWSYDPEKAIYAEYSMERMRAFKGC
nr:MAG TPA: Mind bomb SH3 repeat domain [Bacteriophage sp.]